MKKSILFLFVVSLLVASCTKKDDEEPKKMVFGENPTNQAAVDQIAKIFENAKAGGIATIKANLDPRSIADLTAWDAEYASIKDITTEAEKGKAGKLGKRTLNAKGVETSQLIAKGLIGAFQLNGFNKASMEGVMAKDTKGRREALNKAVAYLLGGLDLTKTKDDFKKANNSFGKYMSSYPEKKEKIYAAIKMAFDKADDKGAYNGAMMELNKWVTNVVAFRAVHYIGGYGHKIKEEGGFTGENVHELSEGLGFAYSLAFAYNGAKHGYYFSLEEAREFTNVDLWVEKDDKSGKSKLDLSAEKIATMFGFKVADAI